MSEISRVALFGKLNSLGYKAIESATVFCKMRGNPYVEVVHWLHQIVQGQDSDIHRIIQHFDLDAGKVATEMTRALDGLPRGASAISDLSQHLEDAVERAWTYASLLYNSNQVRTGHLILGMLKTPALKNVLVGISAEFGKVSADKLSDDFASIVDGSPEDTLKPTDGSTTGGGAVPGEASGAMAPAQMGKEEALAQFCVDSDRTGAERRDRSHRRPRRGNPPDRRRADAPPPEQPDPDGRGRRRQNRRGRRLRASHRAR